MRVLVTRPFREAQQWVTDLSAAGVDAVALPLMQIRPSADQTGLVRVWQHLADYHALMFVSANAVDYFFAAKPAVAVGFSDQTSVKTRAWATGPGTARALMRADIPVGLIDSPPSDAAQFDSEALWHRVVDQLRPGQRVLIVRGSDTTISESSSQGHGRDWFARQVAQVGAQADFLVTYQRGAPEFGASEIDLARQAANDGSVWLFSSSEAVVNLGRCLPGQSWHAARALATHSRIALAAVKAGFGVVCETRPTLPDVLASLTANNKLCSQHFKISG